MIFELRYISQRPKGMRAWSNTSSTKTSNCLRVTAGITRRSTTPAATGRPKSVNLLETLVDEESYREP